MDDIKVYTNDTIKDVAFPVNESTTVEESATSANDTYSNTKIDDQIFPSTNIASELINNVINTQSKKILDEMQFTPTGALQIGKYILGTSGDIRISPSGLIGRNSSGNNTFTIDGTTGSATFSGTLFSTNLLTGLINVGSGSGGAYVRIDGANNRIVVHDGTTTRIVIGNV
jgi:hypothetical protein